MKDKEGEYLFDLAVDPGEKRDLKAEHPEVLERLKSLYGELESQMLEPVPLPPAGKVSG